MKALFQRAIRDIADVSNGYPKKWIHAVQICFIYVLYQITVVDQFLLAYNGLFFIRILLCGGVQKRDLHDLNSRKLIFKSNFYRRPIFAMKY